MFAFYLPLCVLCLTRLVREQRGHESYSRSFSEEQTGQETQQPCSDDANDLELTNEDENATNGNITTTHSSAKSTKSYCLKTNKSHSLFGLIPLQSSPLVYAAISVTDVYANYVTILAFKYTTITSVSLFDALAIPSAIIVSRVFFGRRYTKLHLLGVIVCCIGIGINILQDYREDEQLKEGSSEKNAQEELIEADYPHKMAGDALAILGGILFGITNTLQEVAVRDWGTQEEYLGCMTFFASIITLVQTLAFESHEVMAFFGKSEDNESCSEIEGLTLLLLFVVGGVVNYIGISSFLQKSDAAFLNLSLLTGDAWAVAFSVFAEGIVPPPSFYVALLITVSGVFIYEMAPSPVVEDKTSGKENRYQGGIELSEFDNTNINDSDCEEDSRHVFT
eukprot:scaffold224_cov181-Alexandrium_tamarense.AAC.4